VSYLNPSPYLLNLYTSLRFDAISFCKDIKAYNGILSYLSFGTKINENFQSQDVSNFKIYKQIYHHIESLRSDLVFAYFYIYDTDHAEISIQIYCDHLYNAYYYNASVAASDVTVIMVGNDHEIELSNQNIVFDFCDGILQRISELILIDNGCVNSLKCQMRNIVYKEVFA
jgi:hypothetical protein